MPHLAAPSHATCKDGRGLAANLDWRLGATILAAFPSIGATHARRSRQEAQIAGWSGDQRPRVQRPRRLERRRFPHVLSLYVAPGSIVADVTHGKGVFWRNVPTDAFRLLPSDLSTGTDCRDLPYEDDAIDCVARTPRTGRVHREVPRRGVRQRAAIHACRTHQRAFDLWIRCRGHVRRR